MQGRVDVPDGVRCLDPSIFGGSRLRSVCIRGVLHFQCLRRYRFLRDIQPLRLVKNQIVSQDDYDR